MHHLSIFRIMLNKDKSKFETARDFKHITHIALDSHQRQF
jgi:hypothetical protein